MGASSILLLTAFYLDNGKNLPLRLELPQIAFWFLPAVIGSPITVGTHPYGVAVTPDGSRVYIANQSSNNVSVIDTTTNTVTATVPVGSDPFAFGVFIQQPAKPTPRFAGTPGKANCYGKSVSALVRQYQGLHAAATALGFSSVKALQNAIMAFCGG